MKLLLSILAWSGLVLILFGLIPSYSSSWFEVTAPETMGAMVVGIAYIVSFFGAAVFSVSHPRYVI